MKITKQTIQSWMGWNHRLNDEACMAHALLGRVWLCLPRRNPGCRRLLPERGCRHQATRPQGTGIEGAHRVNDGGERARSRGPTQRPNLVNLIGCCCCSSTSPCLMGSWTTHLEGLIISMKNLNTRFVLAQILFVRWHSPVFTAFLLPCCSGLVQYVALDCSTSYVCTTLT